jgi:hypothetical protein
MWVSILIQAILFAIQHAPELIAILHVLFAFFKANKSNPQLSSWMSEFSDVMKTAKDTRDPKPIVDFLKKLEASLKGPVA